MRGPAWLSGGRILAALACGAALALAAPAGLLANGHQRGSGHGNEADGASSSVRVTVHVSSFMKVNKDGTVVSNGPLIEVPGVDGQPDTYFMIDGE